MFYKGGLVGGLLGRSSTDNIAGEKLGNIFVIRYVWLWSNPEEKFLSSFSRTAFGFSWLSPFTRDTIHSKPFGFPFSLSVEG